MHKNLSNPTRRSLEELESLILFFEPYWLRWSHSAASPLSDKERKIIESYRTHATHNAYAKENKHVQKHVASAYHHAIRKLRQQRTEDQFVKWKAYQNLIEHNIAEKGYDVNSVVRPALRLSMSHLDFISLFEKLTADNPTGIESADLPTIKILSDLKSGQLEQITKTQLCVHLFLSPDEVDGV